MESADKPYNFLEAYLDFNSGNEAPRNYHIWCAFVAVAAAVHKRVFVRTGFLQFYPNLYVGLIGSQGSRKTTAKDIMMDIFTEAFPEYPILASVQSREDIIKYMNEDNNKIVFTDHAGKEMVVRPVVGFINELMNFFSVDPTKSVQFFTDIYDQKRFKSSTIKRGLEDLVNPCVNFLACSTPDWIIDNMKGNIISGGWARRIVYVYETVRGEPVAFPERPAGYEAMVRDMIVHLQRIANVTGEFAWDSDAKEFYDKWYVNMMKNPPEDKMMAGFYESKHAQVLKVCMCLALMHWPVELRITLPRLQQAIAHVDVLEGNMPKLFAAAGKNEMQVPMMEALDMLEKAPGHIIPEKTFRRLLSKNVQPHQIESLLLHMKQVDEIRIIDVKTPGSEGVKKCVITVAEYNRRLAQKEKP